MWKPICTSDGVYLFDHQREATTFIFHLTDLKSIWTTNIEENLLVAGYQETNKPTLDINEEVAIREIVSFLDNVDKIDIKIQKSNEDITMNLSKNLNLSYAALEVQLNIRLEKTIQEKFTDMVTIPMIQTIYFLEKQREMLCNLLKKKDLELEQYRLEKDLISRTELITEKFDEGILKSTSNKLITNVFETADKFMDELGRQYGKIEEKIESVSVEPWNKIKRKRVVLNSSTASKEKKSHILYK